MINVPEISIITPVWNGLPFLKECVESVLAQRFQAWELLISDDGSTDGSREYLASINDSRVKVINQDSNKGIFGNLNFLFSIASAKYSQILCQDDYFTDSDSLTKVMNYWSMTDEKVGFVRFNNRSIGRCELTRYQKEILPQIVTPAYASLYFFIFGNIPGNLSNVSLRTHIVSQSGFFNQAFPFAGDFEFWSRIARKWHMGISDESITYVRRHPKVASVFLNKKGELMRQKIDILSSLFKEIQKQFPGMDNELRYHTTVNFDAKHRYTSFKEFIKGNNAHLKQLNEITAESDILLEGAARWFVFVKSLGGRIGRVRAAKKVLNKIN